MISASAKKMSNWQSIALPRTAVRPLRSPYRPCGYRRCRQALPPFRRLDATDLEQVGAIGDLQDLADVLLDDQHGVALGANAPHQVEHLRNDHRGEAHRRLIQQDQLRSAHERTRYGAHLLLAAGERSGHLVLAFLQARKQRVDIIETLGKFGAGAGDECAHAQVVADRQARKQTAAFGHMRDAGFDDLVRRGADEIASLHHHRARGRRQQPGDHAQQRGLARAVGADHGDGLAGVDLHRHAEQRLEPAIARIDGVELQHQAAVSAPR